MEYDIWWDKGWVCPKCGAVMSPTTSICVNCRGDKGYSIGIGTTSIDIDWTKQQTQTICTEKEIKKTK